MKKLLIILLLASCQKEHCWEFTQTQTTDTNVQVPGYPTSVSTKFMECGITEKEADKICKVVPDPIVTQGFQDHYTITTTTTITKVRK